MARKATSSTKSRKTQPAAMPVRISEQGALDRPRRGRKQKLDDMQPIEPSLADAVVADGEELKSENAAPKKALPAKARRGHKSRASSATKPVGAIAQGTAASNEEEAGAGAIADPNPDVTPVKTRRGRKFESQPDLPPSASQAGQIVEGPITDASRAGQAVAATPAAAPSAAHWDVVTGTVSFDWPAIEQVAAAEGPNQAMAKLLLAARAEGANSRWPF